MNAVAARLTALVRRLIGTRFVRDTAILQAGQFVVVGLAFISGALLARILGPELLGTFYIISALSDTAGVLDISAAGIIVLTALAKALGANDRNGVHENMAYYARINLQFIIPVNMLIFLLLPLVGLLVYGDMQIGLWARWLTLIAIIDVPYDFLSLFYQSRRDMRRLVILETSKLFCIWLGRIAALLAGLGVGGLITAQVFITVLYALYSVYQYRRVVRSDDRFPTWEAIIALIPSVRVGERFRSGFVIAIEKSIRNFADRLPLLALGTDNKAAVGYFGTALKVVSVPEIFAASIARNLNTLLPNRAGQGTSSLREAFIRATSYTSAIWSVVTLGVAVAAPIVVLVMNGYTYLPSVPVVFPLLFEFLAAGFGVGIGSTLRAMNKFRYLLLVHLVAFALVVPMGFWLTNQYHAYGAGWFYGLHSLTMNALGVGMVLWLLRSASKREETPTPSQVEAT